MGIRDKITVINEEKSVEILEKVLKASGLKYRRTKPNEEGGFFNIDKNGKRKKFTENIFIKRSLKFDESYCCEDQDKDEQND